MNTPRSRRRWLSQLCCDVRQVQEPPGIAVSHDCGRCRHVSVLIPELVSTAVATRSVGSLGSPPHREQRLGVMVCQLQRSQGRKQARNTSPPFGITPTSINARYVTLQSTATARAARVRPGFSGANECPGRLMLFLSCLTGQPKVGVKKSEVVPQDVALSGSSRASWKLCRNFNPLDHQAVRHVLGIDLQGGGPIPESLKQRLDYLEHPHRRYGRVSRERQAVAYGFRQVGTRNKAAQSRASPSHSTTTLRRSGRTQGD